ncbi:unnamed protein product [Effrenium voratum]|nr:unnamed protein product [Effrenium voratum]
MRSPMATLKGMGGVLALCLIFTLGVYWWLAIPCSADPACAVSVAAYPQRYHAFVAVGLGVVLLRESFLLLISCAEKAANAEKAPRQLQDMAARDLLAQGLLSLLLLSLSTAETYLAWTSVPWVHSTSLGGVVYSVRYLEWLVNVPLLMLLTCCGALGRPISDATGPILATNAYILISWAALFLETAALRWLLIAGTFAAYGWASRTMLQWVSSFMEDGIDTPCRRTRAASVVLLIVVFGIYGVIYLAGVSGIIDFATEHLGYTFMGFTCKVTLSILFASIRAYQNHQALSRLVTKLSGLSTAFVSLLRGSFDHVLSCSVDRSGSCFLKANGREVAALSRFLGRSVKEDAGTFNELLCKEEQELFANYVKNALRQSENQMQNATVDLSKDAEPPVAHALQVHLQTRSTPDEQTELVSAPASAFWLTGSLEIPTRAAGPSPAMELPVLAFATALGHWALFLVPSGMPWALGWSTWKLESPKAGQDAPAMGFKAIDVDALFEDFIDSFQRKRSFYDRWGTYVFVVAMYSTPLAFLLFYCIPNWHRMKFSRVLRGLGFMGSLGCGLLGRVAPDSGLLCGRLGAAVFSISHIAVRSGQASVGMVLHASTWTSVAVMYQDALAGVAATIAFHGTCMALLAEFDTDANDADEQWWLEGNGKDRWSIVHRLASRAAMASLFLMALALAMSTRLGPFMPGAILGGHVTLQVAALALALGPTTAMRQVAVLSLFGLSAILGLMLESVSLSNSGTLFLLLWFLAKCYETSWANPMFKVFMTLVAMQVVGTNPGLLLEILNPVNLYA